MALMSICDVTNDAIDKKDTDSDYFRPGEYESAIRFQISWKMAKLKISAKFHHQAIFLTGSETEI